MTNLYPSDWTGYIQILFVFLRAMGLFLLLPGLSHPAIPRTFKVLFSLSLALVLYPLVKPNLPEVSNELSLVIVIALRETFIGLLMGFVGYVMVEGAHLAAQFMGYQMGFGTAGLLEPQSQSSVSVIVHLKIWIVLILFFIANLHHHMIQLFVTSFEVTRQLSYPFEVSSGVVGVLTSVTAKMFILAIQLAAPVMFLMLASNVAIAVLARMLPQMNILLFSFPVTILVGFVGLYIIAPDLIATLENVLGEMTGVMMETIKVM